MLAAAPRKSGWDGGWAGRALAANPTAALPVGLLVVPPHPCSATVVPGEHLHKEDARKKWGMPVAPPSPQSSSLPHNQADLHPSQASAKP